MVKQGIKWVIRICTTKKNRQRNGQTDKQQSTKHTYKTKHRVTRTPLKTGAGGELRCSGRVSNGGDDENKTILIKTT